MHIRPRLAVDLAEQEPPHCRPCSSSGTARSVRLIGLDAHARRRAPPCPSRLRSDSRGTPALFLSPRQMLKVAVAMDSALSAGYFISSMTCLSSGGNGGSGMRLTCIAPSALLAHRDIQRRELGVPCPG